MNLTTLRRPLPALAVGVLAVALIGGGTAVAADFVTSKDVKDNSLRSVDVKNGSLRVKDLTRRAVTTLQKGGARGVIGATGAQGIKGAAGTAGAKGDTGAAGAKGDGATYAGPNWSIVDRNVLGNGDSYLRAGPDNAPLGQGSLGMRTGLPQDKAAFGNQVDFRGNLVSGLTQVGFSVFTTGENNCTQQSPCVAGNNMPSILFEIDPNTISSSSNFSSLVYVPANGTSNAWTAFDADADLDNHWGLTGSQFDAHKCSLNGTRCTLAEVQTLLNDGGEAATIYTAQIGKGRDYAFSGAVDALVINNKTYDFEPFGVIARTP